MENFFQGFGLKLEGAVAVLFGFGVVMHYLKLPYSVGDYTMVIAVGFQIINIPIFIYRENVKFKRENYLR